MSTIAQTLTIPNVPAQDVTDRFAIQLRPRTADGRAGRMIYGGTRPELHGCINTGNAITVYNDVEDALRVATERQQSSDQWDFYVIPHPDGPSQAWRDAHAEAAPAIEDMSEWSEANALAVTDRFAVQLRRRETGALYETESPNDRATNSCMHTRESIDVYTFRDGQRFCQQSNGPRQTWRYCLIPHPSGPSLEWTARHRTPVVADDDETPEQAIARLNAEVIAQRQRWEQDIASIGERFGREAVRRGWCGDYERVLSDLNDSLEVPIPGRPRRWEAYFPQTVTLRVQINQQVRNIMAETREAATEQGRSQITLDSVHALVLAALPGLSDRVVRNLLTSMDQVQPREGAQPEVYES